MEGLKQRAFATELVQSLLANADYDIEFHGFLSNHAKHAVIALAGLAAPDERIREYWAMYTRETPYGLALEPAGQGKAKYDESLVGKKTDYASLVAFFEGKDVKEYVPKLIEGIPGALTHAIIHLGWGLAAKSDRMVAEGLAYLAFAHVSVRPDRFVDERLGGSAFEALLVASEAIFEVPEYSKETFHPELVSSGFQWQVAKTLDAGHPVLYLNPDWLDGDDPWREAFDLVALLHIVGKGNFVVLHLITSLWGLDQTMKVVQGDTRHGLRCFWVMTLAILATSKTGIPPRSVLEEARANHPFGAKDDAADVWPDLSQKAIAQDEEHNMKLVFCCLDLWHRYDHLSIFRDAAAHFTDTPVISGAFGS